MATKDGRTDFMFLANPLPRPTRPLDPPLIQCISFKPRQLLAQPGKQRKFASPGKMFLTHINVIAYTAILWKINLISM